MSKTAKELIEEKLSNFKYLIASKITNDENQHFIKLMEYDTEKIICFYHDNIEPYYDSFGIETIVGSFAQYLELDKMDGELMEKIKKYFEFFKDMVEQMDPNI